ncbi:DUF5309 domain-containing protein, partial [Herbiconiux daphne]
SINNKYFQWQHDSLAPINKTNAFAEGSDAGDGSLVSTGVEKNVTQILRKVVQVSDTADALASYGRGSELAYQMEKAGAEIKRDLEWAFLNQGKSQEGTGTLGAGNQIGSGQTAGGYAPGQSNATPPAKWNAGSPALNGARLTAGFQGLTAGDSSSAANAAPDSVGAGNVFVTHTQATTTAAAGQYNFTEDELFALTKDLYQIGATPNIIMYHPTHAKIFSSLMESTASPAVRIRMFDGASDTQINTYVSTIIDPLGQEFKLVPNRFMPVDAIYLFDPADWTQMVLRAPQRTKLAKTGSFEKWMIEMEVGLRHRNPWASGILKLKVGS